MSSGHEHNGAAGGHHDDHGPRPLPASLAAPGIVSAWRTRALIVFAVATILSVFFAFTHEGRNHILRAYLLGYMICFGFAGGGLAMLMLQYVSGGKWGLLLRRPLEAMTRTIWLVGLMFVPIIFLWKHLYQWAAFPTAETVAQALSNHWVTLEQAMTLNAKRAMLNPTAVIVQTVLIFAILWVFQYFLNKWSLERDADPERGTEPSFDRWRIKFENLSGIGILIYVILLTVGAIVWIKSLDITWYSSIWGLQFLVGQGYAVLALGILTVILLSRYEPMKTMLRDDRAARSGQACICVRDAEHLSLLRGVPDHLVGQCSGRDSLVPEPDSWRMVVCLLGGLYLPLADSLCLLLSRDLKRNKQKMIWLTCFMIFARCLDMFWLIEPNFADAAGNLHLAGNVGILAYITVPVAVLSLWARVLPDAAASASVDQRERSAR